MRAKTVLQGIAIYAIALLVIFFLVHEVSLSRLWADLKLATLWIFVPASLGSFLLWFLGETLLFSRLFSYLQRPIKFGEMLFPNAAQYFLQSINMLVAGTALVYFVHREKGEPWLAGAWTLIFQGLIDFQILAIFALLVGLAAPDSAIHREWYLTFVGLVPIWLNVYFWMRGEPRSQWARWIYHRPSLGAFRRARPHHYVVLGLIRAPIFVGQCLPLYFQMLSFGIHVPFVKVVTFLPEVLFLGGLPITPVGLGPLQLVMMAGFRDYAPQSQLLAVALSISLINLVLRLPLGLGAAGVFAREVSHGQPPSSDQPPAHGSPGSGGQPSDSVRHATGD